MNANLKNQSIVKSQNWVVPLLQIGGFVLSVYTIARLVDLLLEDFAYQDDDEKTPRIFISHSWKHSQDYNKLLNIFAGQDFSYYNHSISREKADLSLKTLQIEKKITRQLLYSRCLLVFGAKYADNFWIKKEVEIAQKLGKKIIVVSPRGVTQMPKYLKKCADKIVGFHAPAIINQIRY